MRHCGKPSATRIRTSLKGAPVGDPRLIPIPPQAKLPADVAVIGSSVLGWLQVIPWPSIAALFATVYTGLLILEKLWGWFRKKRRK